MEFGIYIHIPFCIKKCYYCDFISYTNKFEIQKQYIYKLIKELEENKQLLKNKNITTIYIGGGTPSSIDSKYIKLILENIYKITNINKKDIEITIEVNPGTITKQKLEDYKSSGINRLSIGLQSANNNLLNKIGRIHNFNQFLETYNLARNVGFNNINVDLMLGLPDQTIEDIKNTLEEILKLKPEPEHISTYSLIVEEGTKIEQLINSKKLKLPDEEQERMQYKFIKNYLELKGYKHYEISNFAKKGFESKHNKNCWEQQEYLGLGISSHSYVENKRYSNTTNFEEYLKKESKEIKTIHEIQNIEDKKREYMLLGLRKIEGIKISKFKEKFGENPIYIFRKELEKLINQELLEIDLDNIKLTEKGLDLANIVWEEFVP